MTQQRRLVDEARNGERGPVLLGSRCERCGEVVFPGLRDCPVCLVPESMHSHRLAGEGVVREFIVTHRGPAGFPVPYTQAYIELEDGPIVYSMLDDESWGDRPVQRGDEVEMVMTPIRCDQDEPRNGWKFALKGGVVPPD